MLYTVPELTTLKARKKKAKPIKGLLIGKLAKTNLKNTF